MAQERNPRARREADRVIVSIIREKGEGSREYREFRTSLLELVIGTLTNMSKQQRLFHEVARQCRVSLPPPPREWPANSRRVIYLAAEMGVSKFMASHVLGGRWDPSKGASLRTCCVKRGLYSFVDEYRAFCKEEDHRYAPWNDEIAEQPASPTAATDPAARASQRDLITRLLARFSPTVVTIVVLDAEGWTRREVAGELGLTTKQVDYELRKFRDAVRK